MVNRSQSNDPRFFKRWLNSGSIVFTNNQPFSYESGTTPGKYICHHCKASGCKLWREYQTMFPTLLCVVCATRNEQKVDNVDATGRRTMTDDECSPGSTTDQIGWYVPAVPDEEGRNYWGYSSVPPEGCVWWRNLPTRPSKEILH